MYFITVQLHSHYLGKFHWYRKSWQSSDGCYFLWQPFKFFDSLKLPGTYKESRHSQIIFSSKTSFFNWAFYKITLSTVSTQVWMNVATEMKPLNWGWKINDHAPEMCDMNTAQDTLLKNIRYNGKTSCNVNRCIFRTCGFPMHLCMWIMSSYTLW